MEILLTDNEIIQAIQEYPEHNFIQVETWEWPDYELRLVIQVTKTDPGKLQEHLTLYVCSLCTDNEDASVIKKYGRRITQKIRRKFPQSEVHSDLR